jgi:vacuolar protein sorting-associated protein 54
VVCNQSLTTQHLPVAPAELDEEEGKDLEPKGYVPVVSDMLIYRMNLAQSLKSMDHSRYLLLATQMYSTLLTRLHLVERIGNALSQMLEADQ